MDFVPREEHDRIVRELRDEVEALTAKVSGVCTKLPFTLSIHLKIFL